MSKLVICSSVTFYPELPALKKEFEALGLEVTIPIMAAEFERPVSPQEMKTLLNTENVTPASKRHFIEAYFSEIEKGDLVLAYNKSKYQISGYIGPNVLMELSLGFFLKKQLFVWQAVSEKVHGAEELRAMDVHDLGGVTKNILKFLKN